MKRTALLLLLCLVLLAGCADRGPTLNENGELCYPGLAWGMTVEEATDALGTDQITVLDDRDYSDIGGTASIYKYYDISVPGGELFLPAEEVRLEFRAHTREAEPILQSVQVVYAPDADIAALRSAVEAELGPGEPDEYSEDIRWYGENALCAYMCDSCWIERAAERASHSRLGYLDRSASSLTLITDVRDSAQEFYDMEAGESALRFTSILSETFQEDPDHSRTPITQRTAYEGAGILVYPGTMWSMTAEQVAQAVPTAEPQPGGTLKADTGFAGFDGEVIFEFDTWLDGFEPGLTAVEVRFTGAELPEVPSAGTATVADYLYPVKLEWYQELTGMDPATQSLSTAAFSGNVLRLESPMTLIAQLNESERPDPYAEIKALFSIDAEDEWYQQALSCFYASPAELDLSELFLGCITDGSLTPEEREALLTVYGPEMIDACAKIRVTEADMEPILNRYFGASISDCDLATLDQWQYCPETASWLTLSPAPSAVIPDFTDAETLENGDVVLYYEYRRKTCAVTLRDTDGVWQVLSNLIVE